MEYLIALVALTAMEIVLGIDNIVFIAIITSKLPIGQQPQARRLGLALALVSRILLLLAISLVIRYGTYELFAWTQIGIPESWFEHHEEVRGVSVKDLILLAGGLFLIGKSVFEIHAKLEGEEESHDIGKSEISFQNVIFQIAMLDIVFSLDSVITAVGMVKTEDGENNWMGIAVMVTAVIIAVIIMLIFAERVSAFVQRHPTVKMLALSFLILIGVMLVAEGAGAHFNKGYIYFAMAFALFVEFLNLRLRAKSKRKLETTQS